MEDQVASYAEPSPLSTTRRARDQINVNEPLHSIY